MKTWIVPCRYVEVGTAIVEVQAESRNEAIVKGRDIITRKRVRWDIEYDIEPYVMDAVTKAEV